MKKVKQEVKDEAEDWQSVSIIHFHIHFFVKTMTKLSNIKYLYIFFSFLQNLDNWKSSRRKRQEHIIERVVEVKKLELEEHDRQRRRAGKTLSEMMENRGRKLSLNLYPDDDANDLSDLGIGTSSGKSSLSGDAHDDNHSILVSIDYHRYL